MEEEVTERGGLGVHDSSYVRRPPCPGDGQGSELTPCETLTNLGIMLPANLEIDIAPSPKGFRITQAHGGAPIIHYRLSDLWGRGFLWTVWLVLWTAGCLKYTYVALFRWQSVSYVVLLLMSPFWAMELYIIGYVLWIFFFRATIVFHSDRLMIKHSLVLPLRRWELWKRDIKQIRLVMDGGKGKGRFPSWGLVIEGSNTAKILSRQPINKCEWLGSIVAVWAEVTFERSDRE